jgi:hypothetical protein
VPLVIVRNGDDVRGLLGHRISGDLVNRVGQNDRFLCFDAYAVVTEKAEFRHK